MAASTQRATSDPALAGSSFITAYGNTTVNQAGNVRFDLFADWDTLTIDQQCFRLKRKEVSNEEIKAMDIGQVLGLYYSLLNYRFFEGNRCPFLVPHPFISRGLSEAEARIVESDVRERIYLHRPELHEMMDTTTGKLVDVLINPKDLVPICKASDGERTMNYVNSGLAATLGTISVIGGVVASGMAYGVSASQQSKLMSSANESIKAMNVIQSKISLAASGLLIPYLNNREVLDKNRKTMTEEQARLVEASPSSIALAKRLGFKHPAMACTKRQATKLQCRPSDQERYMTEIDLNRRQMVDVKQTIDKQRSVWYDRVKLTGCSDVTNFDENLVLSGINNLAYGSSVGPASNVGSDSDASSMAVIGLLLLLL